MTPLNIEQVNLAITSIAEATLVLQQFGDEMTEPTMMLNRGVGEVRRIINACNVQEHIQAYRLQKEE